MCCLVFFSSAVKNTKVSILRRTSFFKLQKIKFIVTLATDGQMLASCPLSDMYDGLLIYIPTSTQTSVNLLKCKKRFQARRGKNEDSGESGGDITNYFTENLINCNV